MDAYVYILKCVDGTLYTGWTTCLKRRLMAHNRGKGAKYTRGRLPVQLVYWGKCKTKAEAMQWEYKIKRMPRLAKLELCRKKFLGS